jgi:hypothetical protein
MLTIEPDEEQQAEPTGLIVEGQTGQLAIGVGALPEL